MKNILCYGDSNTWGDDPDNGGRYPLETRWPGALQKLLGSGYRVIEEGQGGRTTVWDDPIEEYKNGKTYLRPCLETHSPLDMVVLMLGTNDLKVRFSLNAYDIAKGAAALVRIIQTHLRAAQITPPEVLLVCPPPVLASVDGSLSLGMFDEAHSCVVSRQLPAHYERTAREYGCLFLDAGAAGVEVHPQEGVHFTAKGHATLAAAVAQAIGAHFEGKSP